ncbi:MAG: FHA domain-containing protein [Lentisphaeria bacterium]|nr:FHA domain-containing protein [Lentisphaeria bacterium]
MENGKTNNKEPKQGRFSSPISREQIPVAKPKIKTDMGKTMLSESVEFTHTMPLDRRQLLQHNVAEIRAFIEVTYSGGQHYRHDIVDECYDIGRSNSCGIQLFVGNISRVHAQIIRKNSEYVLVDLNSTNGSFVNSIQVTKCILRDGDVITMGEAKMQFFEEKVRRAL